MRRRSLFGHSTSLAIVATVPGMRCLPAFLAVVPLFASGAAAALPVAAASLVIPDSALHGYVLGRHAFADDALTRAAGYFEAARLRDPGRALLDRRAFELAVAAGDRARATELARALVAARAAAATKGAEDPNVVLIQLTDAVLRKDWGVADALRPGLAGAGYASVVGPIVEAWVLFGRGKRDAALARLDPAAFTGFTRSYVAEQRAHMLAALGRWDEAAGAYAELGASPGGGISLLRLGEADARAAGGDRAAALALLTGDSGAVVAARARLVAGKRVGPLAPDPRRAIAWLAVRLAADLARDRPVPLALLFARISTFLAPDNAATWLICGDVLARSGQREAALTAYSAISAADPLADTARLRRIEVLESLGRRDEAGVLLKAAAAAPGAAVADWTRLGDWHRQAEQFGEAAKAYATAIERAGLAATGTLFFLRGSAHERGSDWRAAEADLREALKRSPDEPVILNYLGYSLLDRGQGLAEANQLIARAAQLRPDDGGVIDSLGWSQYRQGRFGEAVATLEKANALDPNDPTVTEHLGDAYWQVGRRLDARFRWRAALDLDPEAKQKAALAAKLDVGLDAALAMAAK